MADVQTQVATPLPTLQRRRSLLRTLVTALAVLWLAFLGSLTASFAQSLGQSVGTPLPVAAQNAVTWAAHHQPLVTQLCVAALLLYLTLGIVWLTSWAWRIKSAAEEAMAAVRRVAESTEAFKQALTPTSEMLASVQADTAQALFKAGEIAHAVEAARQEAQAHARTAQEREAALGQAVQSSADHVIAAVDAGTERVIAGITATASSDFIFAGELDPVTLNMGDTAAATFLYIEQPVADALARAMDTLHARARGADVPRPGILVRGAPNAGKTRLAFEALTRTLPNWSVLVWSEAHTDPNPNALPPIAAFRDLILFLDDLPRFASAGVSIDVVGGTLAALENPAAATLQALYRRAKQHTRHLAIVATCRTDPESERRLHASLPWLEALLLPVHIPTFSDYASDPNAARIIAEFAAAGAARTDDWNGTLGSLVLGFREKREQYSTLRRDRPAAVAVLCAMKLLVCCGILEHTEQRVRAVCSGVLHQAALGTDAQVWRQARQALVDAEFIRLAKAGDTAGLALVMRKDAYFDSIVTCYPDPRPPAGSSAAAAKLIPLAVWSAHCLVVGMPPRVRRRRHPARLLQSSGVTSWQTTRRPATARRGQSPTSMTSRSASFSSSIQQC